MKTKSLLLIVALALLQSCATNKANYSHEGKKWNDTPLPTEIPKHTLFLIGDAGYSPKGGIAAPLVLLRQKLEAASKESSVIFLGDNIYPDGLPPKSEEEDYELGIHRLNAQLNILEGYEGRIIFLPGNHDWSKYGLKGVRRQEKYIEKTLNLKRGIEEKDDWEDYFIPSNGCSGPEVIEINNQLVIIVVDSQWFLADWDKQPEINDGCEVKSRKDFGFHFEEIVRKNRNKNVVIALHHPLYSYGPHGGYYTFKDHLFPLTMLKKNLYIPLPGIGTLATFLRGTIGFKSDLNHADYKELNKKILTGASKNGSFIFASGHEHNLQYIERERQQVIVSGSGSKLSPAALGKGAEFTWRQPGFAQIDFYADGSAWLQFWVTTNKEGSEGTVAFRKKIKGPLAVSEDNIPTDFPEYEQKMTSKVTPVVTNKVEEKGGFHYFWLGEHYRKVYARQYEFPVLDLSTYRGGMSVIKRGGGNQTNSLRLKDPNGQQFVMRSLTKDASRTVPYPFNKMTVSEAVVQETFLSSHPFAALAVPPMADAIDVYHTNPSLYYIPKQPALGYHNDLFGGGVYLVEERAGGNWESQASLGNSDKLISTGDLSDKMTHSHKHKVDQRWLLRSRLFDQVLGDWDRHDDQWRWARKKLSKDSTTYRAIPRDRDQPFSKYDGVLIQVARLFMPFLRQLKVYSPNIKNMKWSSWSPRFVDNSFLNEMEWTDWEAEAKFIQENLTDEVIDQAFKTWPQTAQELTAEEIKSILRKRRDNLVDFARRHYKLLAKKVDVYGTEKDELFLIERLDNEHTRVRMYHKRDKKKDRLVYDRTFKRSITKEIDVYGLGDKDEFRVTGEARKGILVRLVGGLGKDTFIDESHVSGLSKKTKVYDNKKKNTLQLGKEARDKTSNNRDRNIYDRRHYHYEYDFLLPLPVFGANPDDGFFLGANLLLTKYNFKKVPFGSIHNLAGSVAFATGGVDLAYTGDFTEVVGKWNFAVDALLRSDRFAFNYFGNGNETMRLDTNFNFNRVRQSMFRVYPTLKKAWGALGSGFRIGPIYEQSVVENTPGRFITLDLDDDLPPIDTAELFNRRYFGGIKAGIDYDNKDNLQIPTRGIHFIANASWMTNLEHSDQDFTLLDAELTIYQNIDPQARLVFATRVGAAHRIGDFPFYHSAILGGNNNLRGYRAQRFYGNTSFYHNTDLRLKLFSSVNKVLPFTLGIMGGFDYGRVWLDDENSDKWHSAYGGGLWIAPVDFIVINLGLFRSDEEDRFTFTVGFGF